MNNELSSEFVIKAMRVGAVGAQALRSAWECDQLRSDIAYILQTSPMALDKYKNRITLGWIKKKALDGYTLDEIEEMIFND